MLVYGYNYRRSGRTGVPVRAGTVAQAISHVAEGITNLGEPDPRKPLHSSQQYPLLDAFIKALSNEDDPTSRAYPANLLFIEALFECLDTKHPVYGETNLHIIDLIIVAYFWLLRPGEYCQGGDPGSRSTPFRLESIFIHHGSKVLHAASAPLNDLKRLDRITYASLTFDDQKNATKGETVGHTSNNDACLNPARALGRIALRLRLQRAEPKTPLYLLVHPEGKRPHYSVRTTIITNALQHAADYLFPKLGVDRSLVTARSLRPGGATALLVAGVSTDKIQLLGRWKSDAMFRYLRIQASIGALSQSMLDSGRYTFTPEAFASGGLPEDTPRDIASLLAPEELYR